MATFLKSLELIKGLVQSGVKALIDLAADITGVLPVANGGTGGNDAAGARTNLGLAIGTNVQAFDATLLSFAALSIAANSITVGTGLDAFTQLTIGANTFPARSSSGDVAAKPITDFGLSLVDDADAAAARATLGLGTLATQNGTVSGTNTGDQTITLTGDATGSGTGSFAVTIANDAVTYAKMQNVSATDRLLGRSTAGAGDVEEIVCTAAGRALLDDAAASNQRTTLGLGTAALAASTDFVAAANASPPNLIINGDFSVAQEGATFTAINDDTYTLDQWIGISDGNGVMTVTQELAINTGGYRRLRLKATATNNKKFGILQIIEAVDCAKLQAGGLASLSWDAAHNTGGTITTMRAAILQWGSTPDAVTSDVVSAWNAAGTNPTWAALWTAQNTPAALALNDVGTRFKIEGVSISNSGTPKNLAVVFWTDDTTTTAGDYIDIQNVKLEKGSTATPFVARSEAEELAACRRLYHIWGDDTNLRFGGGRIENTSTASVEMDIVPPMRTPPTVSFTGTLNVNDRSINTPVLAIANNFGDETVIYLNVTTAAVLTVDRPAVILVGTSTSRVVANARF